jgi:hypothetical protein
MRLPAGQYTIKAKARNLNPDATYAPEEKATFTVNAPSAPKQTSNSFNENGSLKQRTWASGQVVQDFTWDATGQLIQVSLVDNQATPDCDPP